MFTRQAETGFTILELIGVIAVIVILMGILLPAATRSTSRVYIHRAKTQLAALEVALNMYYQDWGCYPSSVSGDGDQKEDQHNGNGPYAEYRWAGGDLVTRTDNPGCNLVKAITSTAKSGPYIKFRSGDLSIETVVGSTETATAIYLLDPWDKAYVYTCNNRDTDYKYSGGGKLGPFHNTTTYDLYSFGPGGKTHGNITEPQISEAFDNPEDGDPDIGDSYTDDDINNWSTR